MKIKESAENYVEAIIILEKKDMKSTRLNSSHLGLYSMPYSA